MPKSPRTVTTASVRAVEKRYQPIRCYKYVLDVTWTDKSRYVIYRSLSEFLTMQISLFEAFPIEAGELDSSQRTLPKLTSSSVFVRDEVQKAAEKRKREISDYLNALVKSEEKVLLFPGLLAFFEPRHDDLEHNPVAFKAKKPVLKSLSDKILGKKKKKKSMEGSPSEEDLNITGPMQLETYVAIDSFKAGTRGQISFQKDDLVDVIDKNPNGWWYISLNGNEGWGPATYLDKVGSSTNQDEIPCLQGERYLAIKEYKAELEDELSFEVNVVLEVMNKVLDGWWIASYDDTVGYVPSTHLKVYKNPYLQSSGSHLESLPVTVTQAPRRQSIKTSSLPSKRDLQPYRRATEKRRQRSIKHSKESAASLGGVIPLSLILEDNSDDDEVEDTEGEDYLRPTGSEYVDPSEIFNGINSSDGMLKMDGLPITLTIPSIAQPKAPSTIPLPRPRMPGLTPRSPAISAATVVPLPGNESSTTSRRPPLPPVTVPAHVSVDRRDSVDSNYGYEPIQDLELETHDSVSSTFSSNRIVAPTPTPRANHTPEASNVKPIKPPRIKDLKNKSKISESDGDVEVNVLAINLTSVPCPTTNTANKLKAKLNVNVPPLPPKGKMATQLSKHSSDYDYSYDLFDDIQPPSHDAPQPSVQARIANFAAKSQSSDSLVVNDPSDNSASLSSPKIMLTQPRTLPRSSTFPAEQLNQLANNSPKVSPRSPKQKERSPPIEGLKSLDFTTKTKSTETLSNDIKVAATKAALNSTLPIQVPDSRRSPLLKSKPHAPLSKSKPELPKKASSEANIIIYPPPQQRVPNVTKPKSKLKTVVTMESNNNREDEDSGKIYEEYCVKPSALRGKSNANLRPPKQ